MRQPLVGREVALAAVEGHITSGGTVVVLHGAAGIGKTRLAQELMALGAARGLDTSWCAASRASATIPFAALWGLLTPPETAGWTVGAVLQTARRDLGARARSTPLLIGIDDAHLLDVASLALVHSLASIPQVSLVLTVREREQIPEELTGLWKDGGALRVDLTPLDRVASDRLVAAFLGGQAEIATLAALWGSTRGNPMLLREVLLGSQEQAGLVQEGGRWKLTGHPRLSQRLAELLSARLEGLEAGALRGLAALTLVEPLAYELFRRLVGSDAVQQLERSEMIESSHDGLRRRVHLAQPLLGVLLRTTMLHSQALAATEGLLSLLEGGEPGKVAFVEARRRGDVVSLAELWRRAERPQGATLLLAGAREAIGLGEHDRAANLAQLAVDRDGGFASLVTHGEALTYLGRAEQAEQVLARAGAAAGSELEIVQAALARSHNQLFNLANPLEADRIVTTARERITDRDGCDQLDAALALSATLRGDLRHSLAASTAVLGREDAVPHTLLSFLVLSSVCRALLGDVDDALHDVRRAEPMLASMREKLPLAADQIGITEVLALWHDARIDRAITLAKDGYTSSLARDATGRTGAWAVTLALVLAEAGRYTEASEYCEDAEARLEISDPLALRGTAFAIHARCVAVLGDVPAARALLGGLPASGATDLRTATHAARAKVWLHAADGEMARAAELALEYGQDAIAKDHVVWGAMLLHDAVRLGHPTLALETLTCLAVEHDAGLLQLHASHAEALAEHDPPGLHDVATAFFAHGLLAYAVEAMAQAADLFQRQGDTMAARRSRAWASSLVTQRNLTLTSTPSATPDLLTTREREVALLASHGASSRQIGAHLHLSVRTVDNYLASIYRKTGIAGRHQLELVLALPPAP
jgi:DNA-binding CsgD family transcriptional regulator